MQFSGWACFELIQVIDLKKNYIRKNYIRALATNLCYMQCYYNDHDAPCPNNSLAATLTCHLGITSSMA